MPRVEGFTYTPDGSIPMGAENVSLSDTVEYSGVKGFMVDEDGTLAVTMIDGSSASMVVKAGVQYAGSVKIFKDTGTSSVTDVVVLY